MIWNENRWTSVDLKGNDTQWMTQSMKHTQQTMNSRIYTASECIYAKTLRFDVPNNLFTTVL